MLTPSRAMPWAKPPVFKIGEAASTQRRGTFFKIKEFGMTSRRTDVLAIIASSAR
jgi:hypothetical protein